MKNKKLVIIAGLAILFSGIVNAASVVYSKNAIDESGLAFSKTYQLDLNALNISQLSFQTNYGSATIAAVSFTDGTKSTGNITIGSTSSLVATFATDRLTVTPTANLLGTSATDYITIGSTVNLTNAYITINGKRLVSGINWFGTNTASGTAVSIAAALDAEPGIDASAAGSVVYTTATKVGYAQNSYTLTSSTNAFTVNSSSFTGGADKALDNASFSVNGRSFRQGNDWFVQPTSSETATNIAALINRISGIQAAASGSVVYATATSAGSAGNAFTLTGSTVALTVLTPTFTGGQDNATVTIGGIALIQGRDWTAVSTASGTAKAISDAIVANANLNSAITSTWTAGGVVYATSTLVGSVNFTLAATTVTVSGPAMTGGTATAVNLLTDAISATNHSLTLALPVLLTKTAGTTPAPLATGTTYFAVPVDATTFKLAATSTGAIAGATIDITTQTAAGGGSFTLTPLTITGTPSFKWEQGNDAVNWSAMAVSSVTVASPYTAGSTFWDFSKVNARFIRLNVVGPTTGGLILRGIINGKDQ